MAAKLANNNITASRLQATATANHRITNKEEIQILTSHTSGHDGLFIKIRLFWKSYTFLICLYNTAHMAAQHSSTIS